MTEGERRYAIEERQRLQDTAERHNTRAAKAERALRALEADREQWKRRATVAEAQLRALGIEWEMLAP